MEVRGNTNVQRSENVSPLRFRTSAKKKWLKKQEKIFLLCVCVYFYRIAINLWLDDTKGLIYFKKKIPQKFFATFTDLSVFFLAISTHYYDQSNKIEWCFNKIAIIFAFKFNIFTKFMHIRDPVKLNFGYLYLLIIVIIS